MTSIQLSREPVPLDDSCLTRRVTVSPGMCAGSSLFFGQLGDWTWEAVRSACRTNVYDAYNADGIPTYLSFYYFHVSGNQQLHPYGLAFGDELDVTSRVFDFGRHSVLTLHRVSRAGESDGPHPEPLDPAEVYEHPRPDCMYVENFNRWVSRADQDSNKELLESSPVGFQHEHLPRLPSAYSPRRICGPARKNGTFYPSGPAGYVPATEPFSMTYELDTVRDLNGAGLLYFASYFSIMDIALLGLWRKLGRTDHEFVRRQVLDHRLCYFGNADLEATFDVAVRLWRSESAPGDELADITIHESGTERLLAVAAVELSKELS